MTLFLALYRGIWGSNRPISLGFRPVVEGFASAGRKNAKVRRLSYDNQRWRRKAEIEKIIVCVNKWTAAGVRKSMPKIFRPLNAGMQTGCFVVAIGHPSHTGRKGNSNVFAVQLEIPQRLYRACIGALSTSHPYTSGRDPVDPVGIRSFPRDEYRRMP